MPESWDAKDERMYKHIRNSQEDRGKSEERAEEIAARTVNKHRREEGETENSRTEGTGNPNTSYESRTKAELENIAKERGISGYSRMRKAELIDKLRE